MKTSEVLLVIGGVAVSLVLVVTVPGSEVIVFPAFLYLAIKK